MNILFLLLLGVRSSKDNDAAKERLKKHMEKLEKDLERAKREFELEVQKEDRLGKQLDSISVTEGPERFTFEAPIEIPPKIQFLMKHAKNLFMGSYPTDEDFNEIADMKSEFVKVKITSPIEVKQFMKDVIDIFESFPDNIFEKKKETKTSGN
ncbi:putative SP-containing protein [Vairimorpha necatrix]|uniref:SP-containing protein n=1 Tax=Vairimorpha necatrix TaxID=6039 RepID=A0AAX4J9K3_9MICR